MFVCALVAAGWITALAAKSDPHPDAFDCHELICGMPAHGAYPHFVIGRVAALANAGQAKQLFNGMRRRGKWSALPTDGNLFWDNLQPVAIDAGPGVTVITLTSQAEMHGAPLHVGDFVRYSPHRGRYEVPPTSKVAAAYWHIDGCVAILCRAGDGRCSARYVSGVYRASDGAQLSPVTLVPLRRGVTIDTETMFPKRIKKTN